MIRSRAVLLKIILVTLMTLYSTITGLGGAVLGELMYEIFVPKTNEAGWLHLGVVAGMGAVSAIGYAAAFVVRHF